MCVFLTPACTPKTRVQSVAMALGSGGPHRDPRGCTMRPAGLHTTLRWDSTQTSSSNAAASLSADPSHKLAFASQVPLSRFPYHGCKGTSQLYVNNTH